MSAGCVLIEQHDGWLLMPADSDASANARTIPQTSVSELAQAIRDAVDQLRCKPRVVIAPDSSSCYFANLESVDADGLTDRKSLTFQMESSLPFDAEHAVADFASQDDAVSGVAIEQQRWMQLITALESVGVMVQSVVPLPVLASQALVAEDKVGPHDVLIWSRSGPATTACTDLLFLADRQLDDWRYVTYQSNRLNIELAAIRAAKIDASRIHWVEMPAEETSQNVLAEPMLDAAARSAANLLATRDTPWYDLRRGALAASDPLRAYRGALRLLTIAATVFFVTTIAASMWRKVRFDNEVARIQLAQETAFKEAFPGARVPAALTSRIRSEHRKAMGSRNTGGEIPTPQSAMKVLGAFLSGVPENVRYHVTGLDIRDGDLRVDVQIRAHSDAGKLAAALETSGFSMLPPGTEQINPQTVSSQLEGSLQVSDDGNTSSGDASGGSS